MKPNITRLCFFLPCCLLLTALVACGTSSSNNPSPEQTPAPQATTGNGNPSNPGNNGSGSTQPMPTTQTSCPETGSARAAVMAHLALGNHTNIVYIVNEASGN